jgi:glucose/arabinose dehydrogenase
VNLLRPAAGALAISLASAACASGNQATDRSDSAAPTVTADDSVEPDAPDAAAPVPVTSDEGPAPEPDPPTINGDLSLVRVRLESLATLPSPIDSAIAPNGELWVALREGTVVVLDPATGEKGDTILDISSETTVDAERGLLGIAADATHLYINFTDLDGNTNIDALALDSEGRPDERRNLLLIEQPFPNHNGGGLAIGPDGLLYIGVGDGGAADDPLGAGQDPTMLLGSILRIEPTPEASEPYLTPVDNPFADGADGRPEIFLTGARNPWRFAFDSLTDDLWIADVGQNEWEEIDLLPGADGWGLGANLGWNLREGTHEFAGPRPVGNVDPIFEYPHDGSTPSGCSISGGQVYRGSAIPGLVGSYVFGDFCESTVWAISIVDGDVIFRDLGGPVEQLVGITSDPDGELLALSLTGDVSRIVDG